MSGRRLDIRPGFPKATPYGANIDGDGVHFSLFSRHATRAWLLLYDAPQDDFPFQEIELNPAINRTGDIWHVWVRELTEGQLYLWRLDGPSDPATGHRFDPDHLLLDPYAKALTGDFDWKAGLAKDPDRPKAVCYPASAGASGMPKCVVATDRFEWEEDQPLERPLSEAVIYECHVRGLTAHPNSSIKNKGTFAGVIEMIPYFKKLGINAVEFLPAHEFSMLHEDHTNPLTGQPLENYWGYNTVSFFAPNGRYSSSGTRGQQVIEFKQMVKALHANGIEVYLDVVFNHTAEGNHKGPTICFKGIDNTIYYLLHPKTAAYRDYTGCGNTFNCNHPVVRNFIISCLHYWVLQMHVDGFRFDLASVLGRDENGDMMPNPPLLRAIEEDPVMRGTKIIAEAWDAAGAYQVGEFSGRWAEWNGRFRDDVRRFWRGDPASVGAFATRFSGSSDLYGDDGRTPHHSINFVTSHDGFTLLDWASYEKKYNLPNGHNNTDGDNYNLSFNHGVEGPTDDPRILTLRRRQAKNIFTTLILSLGVPMIAGGDEFLRTQQGNNNAYCQDNEISWFDWDLVRDEQEMQRFVRELIALRKRHPSLARKCFYTGATEQNRSSPDLVWLGAKGRAPDWRGKSLTLGAVINGHFERRDRHTDCDILFLFNAEKEPTWFQVPPAPNGGKWRVAVDTSNPSPDDIRPERLAPYLGGVKRYTLADRACAVLIATRREKDDSNS